MTALPGHKKYTPAEYLALEEKADSKSEYVDGKIFAMAGGSESHIQISFNVTRFLADSLHGKCRAYQSEMKVWISDVETFFYPDVTIACGDREFYQGRKDTITNPILIVEVLSDSTEIMDRGEKVIAYRSLKSLREYVLVWQTKPIVEQYIKGADGNWIHKATVGLKSLVEFDSIKVILSLEEIYRQVEFNQGNL